MLKSTITTVVVGLAASGTALVAPLAASSSAVTTTTVTRTVQTGVALNVRSGSGTNFATVGKIAGGTQVSGVVGGAWLKITSGAYSGKYVSTSYLTAPSAPPIQPGPGQRVGWVMADTTSNGSRVNVRAAMSFSSAVVGHYAPSARVVGTPQGDGTWWKVPGGYIHSALLETTAANPLLLNAKIPANQLCKINPEFYSELPVGVIGYGYSMSTPRYFQCKALPALNALEAAFKAHFGNYAGIDNAYRDWAEQNWWFTTYHTAMKVSPAGKSNHGYGLAVDFQNNYAVGYPKGGHPFFMFTAGGQGRAWLVANESKFGFGDIGTDDAVHFNFVG